MPSKSFLSTRNIIGYFRVYVLSIVFGSLNKLNGFCDETDVAHGLAYFSKRLLDTQKGCW